MKQYISYTFCLLVLILLLASCTQNKEDNPWKPDGFSRNNQLPKVLFITSGLSDQSPKLQEGIVVANQFFNTHGILLRLESRDILYRKAELAQYNFLILSTSALYHDADRENSLSYMSELELQNIIDFVVSGGVVISGDNVGRNLLDGTDRVSIYGELGPDVFEISECAGVGFAEKDMSSYCLMGEIFEGLNSCYKDSSRESFWTLVVDTVHSASFDPFMYWVNTTDSVPAAFKNEIGKGLFYHLPLSDLLHPANDGGLWSASEIEAFYQKVVKDYNTKNMITAELNPWPSAYSSAFTMTFNASGQLDEYKRLLKFLRRNDIDATFFVSSMVPEEVRDYLLKKKVRIQSSGYAYQSYRNASYSEANHDIMSNELFWNKKFYAFRFPYTQVGFSGLMTLDLMNYQYESSIGANNLDFFHGSVVPYNLVISNRQGLYKTTELLEVGPVYHDDYYFLKDYSSDVDLPEELMGNSLKLYQKYLKDYWSRAVLPYNGLMVYLGHPEYVAMNDSTISALESLLDVVDKKTSWIASLDEIVEFRKALMKMNVYYAEDKENIVISIIAPPDFELKNVSIRLFEKPAKVSAEMGSVKHKSRGNTHYIIFNARNNQRITIQKHLH